MDDGDKGTVTLIVNLQKHVGPEVAERVRSMRQCRVSCTKESCTLRIRWWLQEGEEGTYAVARVAERLLVLDPLSREIIPEDTVTKLKGAESKRRLEVLLFKRDKKAKWWGSIVDEAKKKTLPTAPGAEVEASKKKESMATLEDPLTEEELARLPKPGGTVGLDNRPAMATQQQPAKPSEPPKQTAAQATPPAPKTAPAASHTPERTPEAVAKSGSAHAPPPAGPPAAEATMPLWVEEVSVRDEGTQATLVEVVVSKEGPVANFGDLELSISPYAVRLELAPQLRGTLSGVTPEQEETFVVPLKSRVDHDRAEAKWKKKLRRLELRLPRL